MSTPQRFVDVSATLLGHGYQIRFRAHGHSMAPTIRTGDVLLVEPIAATSARPGDILLYRHATGAIAHRVVRVIDPGRHTPETAAFLLRGDALADCDAPVAADRVLGRVVALERSSRRIPLVGLRARVRQSARLAVSRLRRCA